MRNDVDPFAGDFIRHRLHARAAHADTGAHRIDARIIALHGDLRAYARIARGAQDLDETLAHFGNFKLEQLDQKFRRRARQKQLAARVGSERTSLRNAFTRSCGLPARAEFISVRGTKPSALLPRST